MPRKWTMPGNLSFKGWMHGSVFPYSGMACACPSVCWLVVCWEPAILGGKYHLYIFQSSSGMRWHRKVTWGWLLYWFILLVLSFLDNVVSRILERRNEFYWRSESLPGGSGDVPIPGVQPHTLLVESMGVPLAVCSQPSDTSSRFRFTRDDLSMYTPVKKRLWAGFLFGHQPAPRSRHRDLLVMNPRPYPCPIRSYNLK